MERLKAALWLYSVIIYMVRNAAMQRCWRGEAASLQQQFSVARRCLLEALRRHTLERPLTLLLQLSTPQADSGMLGCPGFGRVGKSGVVNRKPGSRQVSSSRGGGLAEGSAVLSFRRFKGNILKLKRYRTTRKR